MPDWKDSLHHRISILVALSFAALSTPAHAASLWTEVPASQFSPATTATITAVEYQAEDRFWFTTGDGSIYRRDGAGTFVRKFGPSGIPLNDIEFQAGGPIGLAVGNGGQVVRSTNGGENWISVNTGGAPIPVADDDSTFPNCRETRPLSDVSSVRFAGNSRVWIFAGGSQVARSQPADPANVGGLGTWVDANRNTQGTGTPDDDTCKLPSGYAEGYADGFFVPSSPDVGYIVDANFSDVFFTDNNLLTTALKKPAQGGNAGDVRRTLVGDPANPGRMWTTAPATYGRSTTAYTTDGWATSAWWRIVNDSQREFPGRGPWDVDFAGGTVLAAGEAGMILNSIDGANFYYVDAESPLATHEWRAVDLASATHGAIGGTNGKLVLTTRANEIPDIVAPTGSIGGPATGQAGQPVSLTANVADNEGGSGIDAASLQWTVEGFPAQNGTTATYTFPNSGSYTVRLSFRDNAGNPGTATKSVSITSPPAPPKPPVTTRPMFGFPAKAGTARRRGSRVLLKSKGVLSLPAGLTAAKACSGTMSIRWRKPKVKKWIAKKTISLTSKCTFNRTLRVKRRKVGKARKLALFVSFTGNSAVAPSTKVYTVKVRRR